MRLSSEPFAVDRSGGSPVGRRLVLAGGAAGLAGLVVPAPAEAATTTQRVVKGTSNFLNVRARASTSSTVVGTVPNGYVVTGYNHNSSWFRVTEGRYAGRYVMRSYLGAPTRLPYVTTLRPLAGGVVFGGLHAGTRVRILQRRLGIYRTGADQKYDAYTKSKVIAFQASKGLRADGVVNKTTWDALNTGYPWTLDAYREDPRLPVSASKAQRVETMIDFVESQLGSPYAWGGCGPKVPGTDCTGVLLQGMHAAGVDPGRYTVLDNARYLSTGKIFPMVGEFYRDHQLRAINLSQRARGDLVFYKSSSGTLGHVALVLGGDRLLHCGTTRGVSYLSYAGYDRAKAPYVKRVFW